MNENESVLTGNDNIFPVDEKNLFVGKHPQERGKAGGATDIIQRMGSNLLRPAVVILKTLNVVFAEVGSLLYLDEYQFGISYILDTVCCAYWNVDGISSAKCDFTAIECNFGSSSDDHPVLGALFVPLITQSFFRQYFDALYLVISALVEHRETTPRSFIV
jgi:hypothetical protein